MFSYDNVYEVYLRNVELHFHTKKAHSTVNSARLRNVIIMSSHYYIHFYKTCEKF